MSFPIDFRFTKPRRGHMATIAYHFTEEDEQLLRQLAAPAQSITSMSDEYNRQVAATFNAFDNPTPRSTAIMHISLTPTDPTSRLTSAKNWLARILNTPLLEGAELPREIKGYIYINNIPLDLKRGSWVIDGSTCYVGSSSPTVEPLSRLAIITCIANLTGAIDDPAIVSLIERKLLTTISDSVRTVYHGFVKSTVNPSRLAIDQTNNRIAAELNGGWYLTSGSPVEVDHTWIVMDF